MSTAELTRQYRRQSLALRAATLRDLQRLWPALDFARIDATFPTFLTGVMPLIQRDRRRAAGLASVYVKAHRLEAGIPGTVAVKLAGPAPVEQVATSMHYTTVEAVKVATRAGYTPVKAMESSLVQTMGSAGRLVLDGGRETVQATAVADPRTAGWQRVTSGGCTFCRMLAGRGAVYSEASSDFEAHDHCACSAEPVYH